MLKAENIRVFNLDGALRGLRNPKNSWDKSDSLYGVADLSWGSDEMSEVAGRYLDKANMPNSTPEQEEAVEAYYETTKDWLDENGLNGSFLSEGDLFEYNFIGPNDLKLAQAMIGAGTDESKFMRQIFISMDITAPLYWWKEFDTYKVGTVADSCSTMHKLTSELITADMFSFDNVFVDSWPDDLDLEAEKNRIVNHSEWLRERYLETKDNRYWRLLVQTLPSNWNQKRTVTLNYQVARAMYFARKNHKLTEWHTLCKEFENLPYGKEFICYEKPKRLPAFVVNILDLLGIPSRIDSKERDKQDIIDDVIKISKALDIIRKFKNKDV